MGDGGAWRLEKRVEIEGLENSVFMEDLHDFRPRAEANSVCILSSVFSYIFLPHDTPLCSYGSLSFFLLFHQSSKYPSSLYF